jgi:hypothetical protein
VKPKRWFYVAVGFVTFKVGKFFAKRKAREVLVDGDNEGASHGRLIETLALGLILGLGIGYIVGKRKELATTVKRRHAPKSKLDALTRDELYERAQNQDIPGRSSMSKDELRDALQAKPADTQAATT